MRRQGDECSVREPNAMDRTRAVASDRWLLRLRVGWPLLVGVAVYAALLAATLIASLRSTEGRLVYAVDDAYIHMAMARNLAKHGVWGVTRYEFTSSSSSPLWTLVLACSFWVAGVRDTVPVALNGVLCVLLLWAVDRLARVLGAPAWQRLGAQAAATMLCPLGFLTMAGMEHVLHAALVVGFVTAILSYRKPARVGGGLVALGVLSALLTAARYESALVIVVAAALLIVQGRRPHAAVCLTAASVPILLMGGLARANGWMFLPASVVLKGLSLKAPLAQGWYGPWRAVTQHLGDLPHIAVLLAATALLGGVWLLRDRGMRGAPQQAAAITLSVALLHLAFMFGGGMASDLRYTGYLSALGAGVAFGIPWPATAQIVNRGATRLLGLTRTARIIIAVAFLPAVVVPAAMLASPILAMSPGGTAQACGSIYRQQYQMARLAASLRPGDGVVLNDIGAVCYYADVRVLDLVGLASIDVARGRLRTRSLGRAHLQEVYARAIQRRRPRLAMLYDPVFDHAGDPERPMCPHGPWVPHVPALLPQGWLPLGAWHTPNNTVCSQDTVSFYALDPNDSELASRFADLSRRLPRDMTSRVFAQQPEPVE